MAFVRSLVSTLGVLALYVLQARAATTISVSSTASHSVPTTLFGQMYEDINHSGDGGLYAELLQNRAFQQVTPNTAAALNAWSAVNGAQLAVISDARPVSSALPNSLQVNFPTGKSGAVGFSNSGFWGIKVDSSWTYNASLFFKFPTATSFSGSLTLALKTVSGETLAQASTTIKGSQTTWKQIALALKPTKTASDTDNVFTVTLDGAAASAQTVNFAMLSLFPPTFKNRPNGMRIDIAEALADMGPSFFRFPGGNNLEGQTVATRWQWNATVGSLLSRPGRVGDWGYANTDGLGLLEYLQFIEDAGMEPIMAVWAGYALGGTSVAETGLKPYIQQAIDQINFVIGDPAKSAPAALRASLGRTQPFPLKFVEIGNEDFFAANSYTYRYRDFFGNLSAAFPSLTFIATSDVGSPVLTPKVEAYDVHVYQTPSWFAQNSFYYDSFARDGTKYFEGEYAAISTNPNDIFGSVSDGRLPFPTVESAANEAAFMTGLERNSDIVFAASYAPLLQHVNSTQWTPDLVSFDAGKVIKSTSFHAQKLFSLNKGDEYLPSTLPSQTGTVFWSVVRSNADKSVIIKVANTVGTAAQLVFQLPFNNVASSGTLQQLTGSQTASNTPEQPNLISPITSTISTGKTINFNAPGFSVSVIKVQVS
ncbi:glycoside hydrolase family 51 protein [Irpex rosettiformis]|uniref:Glycoside hydrolase family 51 protein n=1 Tax=Irpex rosettiformis TaxID=378272 RepID=A0ACB8U3K7_9APHY|nr:glycoside hydrolase family 51 protein [Irpex rosettiformis]